jgi:hypothetical protein
MRIITIAIAAALLTTSGAALAQTATEARCIVLSNVFAKEGKDANAQKLAEVSLYFYLGRVGPQASAAQLKALLDQQARTITDANAGALMGECVKNVQAKLKLLSDVAGLAQPAAKPPAKPEGR